MVIWQVLFVAYEMAIPFAAVAGGIALALRGRKATGWFGGVVVTLLWIGGLAWLVSSALSGDGVPVSVWLVSIGVPGLGVAWIVSMVRKVYLDQEFS